MLRYLRLFARFVEFSIGRSLEFRVDFFFRIVMDLIYYGVNLAFFKVVFLHTPMLAGWTEGQVMVFVSCYLVLDALNMTLFANNLWFIPFHVNKGDLDYYLVRPVSSLFFVSFRDFAVNSFINLVFALGILLWTVAHSGVDFHWIHLLALLALIGVGTFLNYFVRILFIIPVFWSHSSEGLDRIQHALSKMMERPDRLFFGPVRWIVTTVLPFALMASYPARLFLDGWDWSIFLHLIGVTALFFWLTCVLWNFALKSYSSASS